MIMKKAQFEELRLDVAGKAKYGIDFIVSAGLVWLGMAYIWQLALGAYDKSVLSFIWGGSMLPLALLMSKVFKTNWKIKNNPLQPLGLWLNFAQIIYFPFLIFFLLRDPNSFIMAYAIITGAHLFPYCWYYNEPGYAVAAVIISFGTLFLSLSERYFEVHYIPLFTAIVFLLLFVRLLLVSWRRSQRSAVIPFDNKL